MSGSASSSPPTSTKLSGLFSKRSRATPIQTPCAPTATAKELEEAVAAAVKDAETAALKVEEAMLGALQAAQELDPGTQRASAERAVHGAVQQLRGNFYSYERLEEEVAAEMSVMHGPSIFERIRWCLSGFCTAIRDAITSTLRLIGHTISALKTPVLFYVMGCLVYNHLEGWSPLDTVYFLTVTSTTVGYGDICPESNLGKLFTCVYALIGITVVLGSLAPLVAFLRGDWREKLLQAFGFAGPKVDTEDPKLTMEDINKLINYQQRYMLALIGPGFVLCCGEPRLYIAADADLTSDLSRNPTCPACPGMLLHYFFIREEPVQPPSPLVMTGIPVRDPPAGWPTRRYVCHDLHTHFRLWSLMSSAGP